jgi:hypothetical protein
VCHLVDSLPPKATVHRLAAFLALLAVLACTRSSGHSDSQAPTPGIAASPIERCVDNALASSSLVDQSYATRRQWGSSRKWVRGRFVPMVNPPGPFIKGLTLAVESPGGTPHTFTLEYFSPGRGGMQPNYDPQLADLERQAVGEIAAQLLRELRVLCLPSAVPQPTCSMVKQGTVGRCTIGT